MQRAKRYLDISKKVGKKIHGRSYSNFYKGQSLPRTVYKGTRLFIRKGPTASYRLAKHLVLMGLSPHLSFPNGLVSGVEKRRINHWFNEHAKKVCMVIPSYNDYEYLKACIESISLTVPQNLYDLFIVDDYCTEESRKYLKEFDKRNTHVLYRDKNGGFAKAVNTGFAEALKKFPARDIILINSDIVAHEDWLAGLQFGAYNHNKNVGIVGPKLLYPDGRIQSGGSYRNTEAQEWFDHYYRFQPSDYGPANVPQYCLAVTGACMYIKSSTIKKIGMLDDRFQFAFEDVDYCLRAWQMNIRTLYYPAAELTHVESASRPKNTALKPKEIQSVKFFWQQWGDWFDKRKINGENGLPRIIYVLQTTGVSGGHKIAFEHLNRLSRQGYSVELWALDKHPKWTLLEVPTKTFKNYDLLTKALAEEDAIKVATWWETAQSVWLASVNRGIPVYFIQELESWFYLNDPEAQRAVIACYRKEFRNMTTSKYNLDEIRSLGLNATAIPCGYDPEILHQLPEVARDKNTVLALGRSFFQKNFKQTFNAWKLLGDNRPQLLLFGSEPAMAKMDKKITYITKPSDQEVNELYNKATLFVQTSYHEGFCLPVLEAMATGCPVIATDAHGNRDFCVDGVNCIMVTHDDDAALAAAFKKLLSAADLQGQLRQAALKTAAHYQWPVIMKRIEKFYLNIAAQPDAAYIAKVTERLQ